MRSTQPGGKSGEKTTSKATRVIEGYARTPGSARSCSIEGSLTTNVPVGTRKQLPEHGLRPADIQNRVFYNDIRPADPQSSDL